ncbi:acetyl-CoA hydrolase/transferase C-terminal domain-containing protein [Mediterraneibacter agrestimuris]|uniref:acetyl-CoA hydrolase/transferase C-terminal domain-containing protein n=1 Tax=Mediterraneibacter agrestimuris TaxID=2941333 RepID=UPI0020408027|nr:acetyl-CoA hydrolase/transferase C-terminal domain-containing protein [Mediterraneibacter agrestimuris]
MVTNRVTKELKKMVTDASEAAKLIMPGMTLGFSGFTLSGDPKVIPQYIEAGDLTLITSASVGDKAEGVLCRKGLIKKRYPYQTHSDVRRCINNGEILYSDIHLSHVPRMIETGIIDIDYAIIECVKVDDNGIYPTTSVGISPFLAKYAKNIILEVNTQIPIEFSEIADIFYAGNAPSANIIPICEATDRVGTTYIPCEISKIKAIVFTHEDGTYPQFVPQDEESDKIAEHIISFLRAELDSNTDLLKNFPIQSGVGAVANAVLAGLRGIGIKGLKMYTETMQDTAFELLDEGIIDGISTCAICLSKAKETVLFDNIDYFKNRIILRPQDISNSAEVIRRLGVIAMNTPVEFDIYGNVNSTHKLGSNIINGIGGSGDFARNSKINIFATKSTAQNGLISCVVPMVSHCDHTEHDTQIFVTEQGIADLRWKSPKERAEIIINNCAHPKYKEQLWRYYKNAIEKNGNKHTPHDLANAFQMHVNFKKHGSMI